MSGDLTSFLAAARSQIGVPYNYGDEDPLGPDGGPGAGFDCSGLVQWAAARSGITLPRTARAQQAATTPTTDPRPGDLVFFGAPAHHVGIYLGGGRMLNAPHTGTNVRISDVGPGVSNYGRIPGAGGPAAALSAATAVPAGWLSGATDAVGSFVTRGVFVVLGLTLAGLGVWRAVGASRKGTA